MADFYGGPLFEAGSTKSSGDDYLGAEDGGVRLLGEVKTGLCRPRAILFKLLGDTVGLQSRLLMVVLNSQLGASSAFSTSCWVFGATDLTFSTASQFAFSCIPHLLLIYCLDQGLQLEAVPSSSLICANPNKHLSNVVAVDGIDLLVDVMRHPGYLRPFSRKALVMYHIAGAGDSDSAEYDSCDSPLEPNSPMYGVPDKLENEMLVPHFLQ